jgi:hypothetical protein
MKSNSPCSCPDNTCDSSIAELPRYYPRQLITPDDLTLEQKYFRDRMRRHNRLLHGWGVVCGALVCPVPSPAGSDPSISFVPWQVQVQTGYILGPYGDEIILDCPRTVDLRTGGVTGVTGDPCVEPVDPWCSQVFTPPAASTLYIAVKYRQCMTRPVRVQPVGCGCSDTSCEYSRWHDGYEIGVLQQCPPCTDSANKPTAGYGSHGKPDFELLAQGDIPDCPDCHCGPWVGLASVTVNPDGSIKQIDNCSCRRLVLSFSQFWWICAGSPPSITGINPSSLHADGTDQTVTVTGQNFRCGVSTSFGPNVTLKQLQLKDSQTLMVTVNIPAGTPAGTNDVTVNNMDGTQGTLASAINVTAAAHMAAKTAGGAAAAGEGMPTMGRKAAPKKTPKTGSSNP